MTRFVEDLKARGVHRASESLKEGGVQIAALELDPESRPVVGVVAVQADDFVGIAISAPREPGAGGRS